MLDFPTQKKILEPILKDPKNQHCADCNAVSPTCIDSIMKGLLSTLEFSFVQTAQARIEDLDLQLLESGQPTLINGSTNGSATCK